MSQKYSVPAARRILGRRTQGDGAWRAPDAALLYRAL